MQKVNLAIKLDISKSFIEIGIIASQTERETFCKMFELKLRLVLQSNTLILQYFNTIDN